jgi:hypothetical protein
MATPATGATPDPSPVIDAVATPAGGPPAVGIADETAAASSGLGESSPVHAAMSPAPGALAWSPASKVAATPATHHATPVLAPLIPSHQSPLALSTILAGPSRAVDVQTTRRADGQVRSPRTEAGGAQPRLPLGPSGSANAASAAGAPGSISSLLWCAILVGLLAYCAQELRRHRVRVLPARSVLAISLHPRPG